MINKISVFFLCGFLLSSAAMAGSFEWNQERVSACGEVKFEDMKGFTRYKIVLGQDSSTGEDVSYNFRSLDLADPKMESKLRDHGTKKIHVVGWAQSADAIDSVIDVKAVDSCLGLN